MGAEFQTEPVVVDTEITVAAARHRLRQHRLHLLRHHADIGPAASEIAEAVVSEAVVEMTEQHDVVFQRDVGTPAATASAETAASAATEAATASAMEAAAATTACKGGAATSTTTAVAHLAARRCQVGRAP